MSPLPAQISVDSPGENPPSPSPNPRPAVRMSFAPHDQQGEYPDDHADNRRDDEERLIQLETWGRGSMDSAYPEIGKTTSIRNEGLTNSGRIMDAHSSIVKPEGARTTHLVESHRVESARHAPSGHRTSQSLRPAPGVGPASALSAPKSSRGLRRGTPAGPDRLTARRPTVVHALPDPLSRAIPQPYRT